jgi:hypothetical protein
VGKNGFFFGLNVQMDFTRIEKKVHENISSVFNDINVPIRFFKNRTTLNSNFISWKNLIG